MKTEIIDNLASLSRSRPLFHSEADFQHAFSLQLCQQVPECNVRLEYPTFLDGRIYLDAVIIHKDRRIGVEFKYMTDLFQSSVDGQEFKLKRHGARDLRRYDFFKDVYRLESLVNKNELDCGYAIFLTNDSNMWKVTARKTPDKEFYMYEDRTVQAGSMLSWAANTPYGTVRGREAPLEMLGQYHLKWDDFSEISGHSKNNVFRYLLVETLPASPNIHKASAEQKQKIRISIPKQDTKKASVETIDNADTKGDAKTSKWSLGLLKKVFKKDSKKGVVNTSGKICRFVNDNEGYLKWLDDNPGGFVLNCEKKPNAKTSRLHGSTCHYIGKDARFGNWTNNQYIKICSLEKGPLLEWTGTHIEGELKSCKCI